MKNSTALHDDGTPVHSGDRARELERENRRLKLLVGELMLEIAFLKDTVQAKHHH